MTRREFMVLLPLVFTMFLFGIFPNIILTDLHYSVSTLLISSPYCCLVIGIRVQRPLLIKANESSWSNQLYLLIALMFYMLFRIVNLLTKENFFLVLMSSATRILQFRFKNLRSLRIVLVSNLRFTIYIQAY